MRHSDVVIVGGGFAGSLAAGMLDLAGINTVLVDLHPTYPADFRCEKLDGVQLDTLRLTGLADAVIRASTPDHGHWVARFGRIVERRPGDQRGVLYENLVNIVRSQISDRTAFIHAKVVDVATGPEQQTITLSTGEVISARLVILATGLNIGLCHKLGIEREITSAGHSIAVGFDAEPANEGAFSFPSLTYFAERPTDRMAYITLFPIGSTIRANLFAYRNLHDPWFKEFRGAPQDTLYRMWPNLRRLMGDFTVPGFIKVRPIDLYVSKGYHQDGVVLVGDAFATSCPAAGTGARKVLTDVERLCNVYVPRWLATAGMGTAKIAAFYDDPLKQACDARSARKAYELRSYSIDPTLSWTAMRWAKFFVHWGKGTLRQLTAAQGSSPDPAANLIPKDEPKWVVEPLARK